MSKASASGRSAALVATGGYGRGELFPCSDVDILVLLADEPTEAQKESLERLIGAFWDIGLEIGHSVRTVDGCLGAAREDITIRTALLESRYLSGSRRLYKAFSSKFRDGMDAAAFLKAKRLEQEQRHAKHQDTPYSLEPNLKEAPCGLRDLQGGRQIGRAQIREQVRHRREERLLCRPSADHGGDGGRRFGGVEHGQLLVLDVLLSCLLASTCASSTISM